MTYAIIANPTRINTHLVTGHVVSRHRTLTGAARALERHQAPTRRANPGSHLDLQPVVVEKDLPDDRCHGRYVDSEAWLTAQFAAGIYS